MPVQFDKLVKGDTLKAGRTMHFPKNDARKPIYKEGESLQVLEVMPAGVKVENKDGKKAEYYFTHGASKLEYTAETIAAIKKRESFKASEEAANGEDPTTAMKAEIASIKQELEETQAQLEAQRKAATPASGKPEDKK